MNVETPVVGGDAAESAMVDVPAGEVTLTDRRTSSSWTVEVAPYRLAAAPVTRACYARITGEWPSTAPQSPGAASGGRLPVESVSWWDAIRFCNAMSDHDGLTPAYRISSVDTHAVILVGGTGDSSREGGRVRARQGDDGAVIEWDADADGYRLPTEAEWEHACRAGTAGPRYGPLDEIAWYRGNSGERIREVAGKRPNAWGLSDMLGNVWEWCWDRYDPEVYGEYRVLRGGGWFDDHWSCRASVRRRSHPLFRTEDVGFRVALSGHAS